MNKKTLTIIIASVLAVALVATGVVFFLKKSFNESKITFTNTVITVGSVSGSVGEKVTVPVSIKGNPGIMAMLLEFGYDNTVLKYTGYTPGDFLTNYQFNDQNGTLNFLNLEDNDINKNGVLVNLEFEILKSTSKTDITIKISDDSIANQKEELISAKGVNGTVTIK